MTRSNCEHAGDPDDPGPDRPRIRRFGFDAVGSTNDLARRHLEQGGGGPHEDGLIVVSARRQTAGRGRLGRAWESPEGGLWLTIAGLQSPDSSHSPAPARVLALAVAAADTLDAVLAVAGEVLIRWPNDLLIGNRKVGGLLGEGFESRGRAAMLVGVGINANNPPPGDSATRYRTPATSLAAEIGGPVDLDAVRDALIAGFASAWAAFDRDGFDARVRDRFERRLAFRGERVRLEDGARTTEGRLAGVGPDGSLLLETDGLVRPFAAGELSCRPADR